MNDVQAPFGIYYASQAYSTAQKIMGRQSASKSFMAGIARTWPQAQIDGLGVGGEASAQAMYRQLASDGFTGKLRWHELPHWQTLESVGSVYYPSPVPKDLAFARNAVNPALFSWMGVTFTLSSSAVMDQLADLVLPPFKPWDALICISQAGRQIVTGLHDDMREWWARQAGVQRFNTPQLPVIPLGVELDAFTALPGQREAARIALGLQEDEVVFLFAGRLSMHAKANPAPMYQAMEQVARLCPLTCLEAGIFPNQGMRDAFLAAQRALAPSVRFVLVDGHDAEAYRQAWQGADVFVSLADNVQETFGLTPIEAKAAGLSVIVSDWNGYKENIRHGIDGLRVPTTQPPPGTGGDMAQWHALELEDYDFHVGRASMATVIDPAALVQAMTELATRPDLRRQMGAAGAEHARQNFDWRVILRTYGELAAQLNAIRQAAGPQAAETWPARADPFARFASFSSATLQGQWRVSAQPEAMQRLSGLLELVVTHYAFHPTLMPGEPVAQLLALAVKSQETSVNELLAAAGQATPVGVRALMWLWKFDLIRIGPAPA